MHNICEAWLGQDKYSFETAPYNYQHKINVDEGTLKYFIELCDTLIKDGSVLWYFITFTEFNPETGESNTKTWHKAGEVKQKILLNQDGKQDKKKIKIKTLGGLVPPPAHDDWLADIEPGAVVGEMPVPVPPAFFFNANVANGEVQVVQAQAEF